MTRAEQNLLKIKKGGLKEIIKEAVRVLRSGGIVIHPTETCYGVGVDATNKKAVDKLLKYKKRPEGKAISIAAANREMAEKYVYLNLYTSPRCSACSLMLIQ